MKEIFPEIYSWFESLFGNELYNYLYGYNCDEQAFTDPDQFNLYGLWMLLVTLAVACIYYLALNHPRLNHLWHWLVAMFLAVVTNFFWAFLGTKSDFDNGLIPDCLMYEYNEDGEVAYQLIYLQDCVNFGASNAIITIVVFALVSCGLKYASRNCKCVPF